MTLLGAQQRYRLPKTVCLFKLVTTLPALSVDLSQVH